jgi:hypothetical protein
MPPLAPTMGPPSEVETAKGTVREMAVNLSSIGGLIGFPGFGILIRLDSMWSGSRKLSARMNEAAHGFEVEPASRPRLCEYSPSSRSNSVASRGCQFQFIATWPDNDLVYDSFAIDSCNTVSRSPAEAATGLSASRNNKPKI